jgi:hypothetical protein
VVREIDTATDQEVRVMEALREHDPALDPSEAFEMAVVAVAELGLSDMHEAVTRAAIGFAEKEAELMGWDEPGYRYPHGSFEELIAARMTVWREEIEAGIHAMIERKP